MASAPLSPHGDGDCVSFPGTLRSFDRHLAVLGRADRTRAKYRYELTRWWCDYLYDRDLCLCQVRSTHVDEYLAPFRAKQGGKFGDAARAIKAYFRFAAGDRLADPSRHVKIPRPRLAPAPRLPEGDLRDLLRAAFAREDRRGWAIMLCYATGSRVGAFAAVRREDVDFEGGRIWFLEAKGGTAYWVPLGRKGRAAAVHLVALGLPTLVGVGPAQFRNWVHAAEQDAGLPRVWPHLLRHTFATRVAHASADPDVVRRLMNWKDLSQWPRYVGADAERMREAADGA